jgi:hypothetical protein
MPYNPNIVSSNIRALEYNKFVEIYNDSRFPPITSVIESYDGDTSQTNIYPKNALLTYLVNADQISLSAGNLDIGTIKISDGVDDSILASVKSLGVNDNALQVITAKTTAVSGSVGEANVSNWGITQVQVTTAAYTAFPSAAATTVTVSNTTNQTLLLSKGGAGIGLPLLSNSTIDVTVVSNVNEIQLKGTTSPVPVSAYGVYYKY